MSTGALSKSEVKEIATAVRDPATKGYEFVRTAFRVKDPKKSIKFYTNLGMTLLHGMDIPPMKATCYSMGYIDVESPEIIPFLSQTKQRDFWAMTRKNTLELLYNWGTEEDPEFKYDIGTGFGNISFLVPDVREATKRLQNLGVVFKKTPDEGTMKGLAFFSDPDGYVIEMYDEKAVHDNI